MLVTRNNNLAMIKQRASTPRYSLVPVCVNVGVCVYNWDQIPTNAWSQKCAHWCICTTNLCNFGTELCHSNFDCYLHISTTICLVRFVLVSFFLPLSILHTSPFDHYYSFSLMARGEKPNGTYLPPPVNLPPRSNRPPLPDREHRSVGARSEAPQRSAIPPYISPLPLDGMSVCVMWMYLCVCARECWSAMTWLWINPILTKSLKSLEIPTTPCSHRARLWFFDKGFHRCSDGSAAFAHRSFGSPQVLPIKVALIWSNFYYFLTLAWKSNIYTWNLNMKMATSFSKSRA